MSVDEKNRAELALGLHAVVRMKVAPVLRLDPTPVGKVIDQLENASIPVQGTCENLIERIPCRLEWKIQTDLLGEVRTVLHPRPTELAPNGKTFTVVETGKSGVSLSAFDVGLVGTGKLGYVIYPVIPGGKPVELGVDRTQIDVKLPIALVVSNRKAAIGTKVELRVDCAACFASCAVQATIGDGDGPGDHATEVERAWQPADLAAKTARPWWVGRAVDVETANGPPQLAYRGTDTHVFMARLKIVEPPPPPQPGAKPGKPPPKPRSIEVPAQPLLSAAHPTLDAFTLGLRGGLFAGGHVLVVEGRFAGFDPELSFALEVNLYAHAPEPGFPRLFWNFANDPWLAHEEEGTCTAPGPARETVLYCSVAAPRGSVFVERSAFRAELFDLDVLGPDVIKRLTSLDIHVFAELSFPGGVSVVYGSRRPVFASVAGFSAAMAEGKQPASMASSIAAAVMKAVGGEKAFAPFLSGNFSWPAVATGVCSNVIDMRGRADELRAPAPNVRSDQWDEYVIFVATVAGEALGSSAAAWKAVASSIMNRVGNYEWGKKGYDTVTLIVQKTGYDAYTGREHSQQYQDAVLFLNNQAVTRPKNLAALRELVPVITPIYLGIEKDKTDVVLYFSPRAQAAAGRSAPAWSAMPDVLDDVTHELLGDNKDDFKFYRYKKSAPKR